MERRNKIEILGGSKNLIGQARKIINCKHIIFYCSKEQGGKKNIIQELALCQFSTVCD